MVVTTHSLIASKWGFTEPRLRPIGFRLSRSPTAGQERGSWDSRREASSFFFWHCAPIPDRVHHRQSIGFPLHPQSPMFSKRSLGLFSRCYKPGPRGRRWVVCTVYHTTSRSFHISRYRFISGPSIEILDRLGLVFASHLAPPNHHPTRAMESIAQGGEMYMTSEEMYRHLNYIQGFVSPESRTHFQIETDIFRASAMLGGDRRMALKTDDGARPLEVPLLKRSGIRKLSGPTGYNVGVVANAKKGSLLQILFGPPNSGLRSSQHPPNTTMGGAGGIVYRQGKISGDFPPPPAYSYQDVCRGHTTQVRLLFWWCPFFPRCV